MNRLTFFSLPILWVTLVGCGSETRDSGKTSSDKQQLQQQQADANAPGDDPRCTYRKTTRKRADTFPFSVADKIDVVSFEGGKMTLAKSRFEIRAIQERFGLNRIQTDSLFSILYDYGYRESESSRMVADCYDPQHAILFYRQNKAIAFLEICFTCGNTRESDPADFGEFCQGKITIMNAFVKQIGIRYGLPQHTIPY